MKIKLAQIPLSTDWNLQHELLDLYVRKGSRMPDTKKVRAAILISGSGTTMENLIQCANNGSCDIVPVGVISSKSGVAGLAKAQKHGIPTQVVSRKDFTDSAAFSRQTFKMVNAVKPDMVILAGFLSYLHIPERYKGKILNIHPSLLPKFGGKGMYGINVHRAVVASDETETGCSVHYVDEEYDHGAIILQRKVEVKPDDTPETLQDRVMAAERKAYPEAINLYAEKRLMQVAKSVRILPVKA